MRNQIQLPVSIQLTWPAHWVTHLAVPGGRGDSGVVRRALWMCKSERLRIPPHTDGRGNLSQQEGRWRFLSKREESRPHCQPASLLFPREASSRPVRSPLRNRGRAVTVLWSSAKGSQPGSPAQLPSRGQEANK